MTFTFTFYDTLTWFSSTFFFLIVPKLLTRDYRFHLKERLYFLAAASILTLSVFLIFRFSLSIHIWNPIVLILILLIYFCKIKSYTLKKAIILTVLATLLINLASLLQIQIQLFFSPFGGTSDINPLGRDAHMFLRSIPPVLLEGTLSILLTLLFVRLSRKLRNQINNSMRAQTVLAWVCGSVLAFLQLSAMIMHYQADAVDFLVSWEIFFLVGFSGAIFVSFLFYMRSLRERMTLQQKEAEQESLQYYTQQIEQHQSAMRKFKHDYQNIFTSLHAFITEKDWEGLTQYYTTRVAIASEVITKSDFTLEGLSKIKVREIKSILAAKLMQAQNLDIDVNFEATEYIDHISVDSVVLVRMLGIILDNAMEEVESLGAGQLMVACYKTGAGVTFVVQNTCRANIESLRELEQVGFSTKGDERGLGLNNLAEMVATHSDHMTLQTIIEHGNFIQILKIGGLD